MPCYFFEAGDQSSRRRRGRGLLLSFQLPAFPRDNLVPRKLSTGAISPDCTAEQPLWTAAEKQMVQWQCGRGRDGMAGRGVCVWERKAQGNSSGHKGSAGCTKQRIKQWSMETYTHPDHTPSNLHFLTKCYLGLIGYLTFSASAFSAFHECSR